MKCALEKRCIRQCEGICVARSREPSKSFSNNRKKLIIRQLKTFSTTWNCRRKKPLRSSAKYAILLFAFDFPLKAETHFVYCIAGQLTNRFNVDGLQQDHPCVIDSIRRQFLHQLWLPDTPLNLDHLEVVDPSAVQSKIILPLLQNQVQLKAICLK